MSAPNINGLAPNGKPPNRNTASDNLNIPNPANEETSSVFVYPEISDGPYKVLDQYHSRPRKTRIACAGAGASGLCLAYKTERMLVNDSWELTIFEKNGQVGGTWYENTYPGVACDIPSHIYTFTFDPNPDWSHFYAHGEEIQKYFEGFADRYSCRKYVKFETKVVGTRWNQSKGIWNISLEDQQSGQKWEDWAHCFINGTGILNNWKWPDIPGLHDFDGPLMHSAKWDHSVDMADKVVGVIGTGSTSVQIVPQLQKICKKVKVFMRSPTYVSPPFGAGVLSSQLKKDVKNAVSRQHKFTEEEKQRFRDDPAYFLTFRKTIEAEINSLFAAYKQNSALNNGFRKVITEQMLARIGPGNEALKKFIIPKWAPGCRRISPGDGYLEALVEPNVECIFGELEKVEPRGVVIRDGSNKTHEVDIIVCATGFQVGFKPAFPVVNGEGLSIQEDWADSANMYFGISAPRFPNFFTMVGPGATWSNGTLLPSIETSVEYALKMIRKMQHELIKCMHVKQEALDDIYAHFDDFHKGTVWQENCRSWFKDGKIKNRIYLWPGSTTHFVKSLKDPRMEDYNIEYRYRNRFAYLGNGDVKATATADVEGLAPHIRSSDHEWSVE